MDEFDASLVRRAPVFFDDLVDQVVLAVPEPAHCFSLRGVVHAPLGELDTARYQKIANAVEAGLPVNIQPVVRDNIEGTKYFASLRRTLLQKFVKHPFPASRVDAGSVG